MISLPLNSSFEPIATRNRRSTIIAAELKRLIHTGQLKAGDQLPTEAALCKQFGVSRTTLREAIQMLRTSGLLDVTPGRGSFIRTPDLSQLLADIALTSFAMQGMQSEVASLRTLIQRDIIQKFNRIPASQRGELHQFTLNKAATAEQNAEAEMQWHLHMAKLCGAPLAQTILHILLSLEHQCRIEKMKNADHVLRTMQIQMRINTALVDGDVGLAERVMTQYLQPAAASQPNAA